MSTELAPIWPDGIQIPIIGLTGPHGSGKSIFGVTIDPEHLCYYDLEKSGVTYVEQYGIKTYVDVRQQVTDLKLEKVPDSDGSCTNRELFLWWLRHQRTTVRKDEYSVCLVDPINDLESGLVAWMKSRYAEFGYQNEQRFASMKGVFWSQVNEEWKRILLELSARCQTLVFTTHTKQEWVGDKPVKGSLIPKGKSILTEIATAYWQLERDPLRRIPSATYIKAPRLGKTVRLDNEFGDYMLTPIIPPRIDKFTPGQIRRYIKNPPDFANLRPEEVAPEIDTALTADERLLIRREIAENERVIAETSVQNPADPGPSTKPANPSIDDIERRIRGENSDGDSGAALDAQARQQQIKTEAKTIADPQAGMRIEDLFNQAAAKGVYEKVAQFTIDLLNRRGIAVLDESDLSLLTPEELNIIAGKLAKTPAAPTTE